MNKLIFFCILHVVVAIKNMLRYALRKYSQQRKSLFLMGSVKTNQTQSAELLQAHKAFFPCFVDDCSTRFKQNEYLDVVKRFEKLCYYHGCNREFYPSLIMLSAYSAFKNLAEDLKLFSMLSWSFEAVINEVKEIKMITPFFKQVVTSLILLDDLVDNQENRWKKSCWHRQCDSEFSVITDSYLLRSSGFYILKKYFGNHQSYNSLLQLLSNLVLGTTLGQTMDMDITNSFRINKKIDCLTMDKYLTMVRYKSYIPIIRNPALAVMHLIGNSEEYGALEHIFEKLGPHPQITNDVWDCFGKYESYGRTNGNDIAEGKFSWVLAKALQSANEKQKLLLKNNYGKSEAACQKVVIDVFKEIDLVQKYLEYKVRLIDDIDLDTKKLINPFHYNFVQGYVNICLNVNDDL